MSAASSIKEPTVLIKTEEISAPNKNRPACTECQRRKQKCNREWPCDHCLKRKVADRCRFNNAETTADKPAPESRKKRPLADRSESPGSGSDPSNSGEPLTLDEASGFKELGYMPSHHLYRLALEDESAKEPQQSKENSPTPTLPQLIRALEVLPPRPYTDILVETFKDNVNFHYYILYPPAFLDQYRAWWADRAAKKPLDLSWTCLLLIVCACSSQYLDADTQKQLELDLGETAQNLTQRYQTAAQELGNVVPSGERNLQYVQYLLHNCYWFKSEARFVECWHTLNSAIREAQELGIHREEVTATLPEFDREMRRRLWSILDTWDWQISGFLSRPMIIDRSECDVELPSLALENDKPSPILHMKLQSKLIGELSQKYGKAMNLMVSTPSGAQEYRQHLEKWRATFPPHYDGDNPDTSMDKAYPWLVLHRHYLQTISLLMILDPFKSYLTRTPSSHASREWMDVRATGIDYCLKVMGALRGFFNFLYPRDAKFHFVLFCIFDVSTVLCSAILHDEEGNLHRRDEVYESIDSAADMLEQLNSVTKSAKTSNEVLQKLKARLPDRKATPAPALARPMAYPKKKLKKTTTPAVPSPASNGSSAVAPVLTPTSALSRQGSDSVPAETPVSIPSASSTTLIPSAVETTSVDAQQSSAPPSSLDVSSVSSAGIISKAPSSDGSDFVVLPPSEPQVTHNTTDAANVPLQPNYAADEAGYDVNGDFGVNPAQFYASQPGVQQDFAPPPAQYTPGTFDDLGFGVQPSDLGDFGEMWGWSQLDLSYTPQTMYQVPQNGDQQQQQQPPQYDGYQQHYPQ